MFNRCFLSSSFHSSSFHWKLPSIHRRKSMRNRFLYWATLCLCVYASHSTGWSLEKKRISHGPWTYTRNAVQKHISVRLEYRKAQTLTYTCIQRKRIKWEVQFINNIKLKFTFYENICRRFLSSVSLFVNLFCRNLWISSPPKILFS